MAMANALESLLFLCSDERQVLRLPTSLEDARALGVVLRRYSDRYLLTVTTGFTITYILCVKLTRTY